MLGCLLCMLAAIMLVPLISDLSRAETTVDLGSFVASALITGFAGGGLILGFRRTDLALSLRSAFVLTSASWLVLAFFSSLPFLFGGSDLSLADAYFEAMSGLTTTGSTVIVGLDSKPPGMLLWRSILHWIGGIGIIVGAIVILPFLRVGGMQLFRLESSEKSDKTVPSVRVLVSRIFAVYVLLTALCALLYHFFGMSRFDAVNHAMATVSTGGFSTHDTSFAFFGSTALEWICVVFMLLGALPFVRFVQCLRGDPGALWRDSQIRVFLTFLVAICASLGLVLSLQTGESFFGALRTVSFSVVSVVTTTGFAVDDYQLWGPFFIALFLGLTVIGGCTGSTAGGVKIFRFEILWLGARNHVERLFSPNVVLRQVYAGRRVSDEVLLSVVSFVFLWFAAWGLFSVALGATGLDLVTAVSATATALANVGPGLGPIIGPVGNFATLPDAAKWVLSLAMMMGRLEIFTLIVLFMPQFWRD